MPTNKQLTEKRKEDDMLLHIHGTEYNICPGAHLSGANLSGADLSKAHLPGANLSGADLSKAHLPGANLSEAHLSGANLSGADLSKAHLPGANLSEANLSWANLSEAHLSGADLSGANLSGADLSGADLSEADLFGADLSGARGYRIVQIGPIGSRADYLVYKFPIDEISTGCFRGTLVEFANAVTKTHGDNEYAQTYNAIITFLRHEKRSKTKC